jgi:RND family efflux transporter MFP subunit
MKIINWLGFVLCACLSNTLQAADFEATVELSPRLELSLPVSGMVKSVSITAGQRVSKGDELLALDPAPFNAAKAHAQSRIAVQQTILKESLRDLKQQQELYERTVLATVELENAELRVKRDRAGLADAQAQLDEADYALAYSGLVAPFDALILSVDTNPGQSINNALNSRTLITLVRQGQFEAVFYVAVDELEKLTTGQKVTVALQAKAYPGSITGISYVPRQGIADKAGLYRVEADFSVEDQSLPIGYNAKVHID